MPNILKKHKPHGVTFKDKLLKNDHGFRRPRTVTRTLVVEWVGQAYSLDYQRNVDMNECIVIPIIKMNMRSYKIGNDNI